MELIQTAILILILIFIGRLVERVSQNNAHSTKKGGRERSFIAPLKQQARYQPNNSQDSAERRHISAWERRRNGYEFDAASHLPESLSEFIKKPKPVQSFDEARIPSRQNATDELADSSSQGPVESIKFIDLMDELELRDMEEAETHENHLCVIDEIFENKIFGVAIMLDGERKAYNAARKAISALRLRNWQVHAQVAMGEFIETGYRNARKTFNSKRVDVLICDKDGMPRLAVEHQGDGHIRRLRNMAGDIFESKSDIKRNAVKKKVLERAGVPLVETEHGDSEESAYNKIESALLEISSVKVDVRSKSIDFDE